MTNHQLFKCQSLLDKRGVLCYHAGYECLFIRSSFIDFVLFSNTKKKKKTVRANMMNRINSNPALKCLFFCLDLVMISFYQTTVSVLIFLSQPQLTSSLRSLLHRNIS